MSIKTKTIFILIMLICTSIIFTWLAINSHLIPISLNEVDSRIEFDFFINIPTWYFLIALFSSIASVIMFCVVLYKNDNSKSNFRMGIYLSLVLMVIIAGTVVLPLTIKKLNTSRRQKIENYIKNNPTESIKVVITRKNQTVSGDFFGFKLKKIKKNDEIPFEYFELWQNDENDKISEGDTLNFIISKQNPNIFELRYFNGLKVQDI